MKQVIFLSTLILLSGCGDSERDSSSASSAPALTEVFPVSTPNSGSTPRYVYSSTKYGTIVYAGSCTSTFTTAFEGWNSITFNSLSAGTYSDCTLTLTDLLGNTSNTLTVSSFTVDSTAPTLSSVYPADNQSSVPLSIDNITFTFSKAMDLSTISADVSSGSTSCSGSLQVSSDSFSTCVQMSSTPTASNDNKTFTITPSGNLTGSTTYKMRVKASVKDAAGNSISGQIETSNGFMTRGGEAGGNLV